MPPIRTRKSSRLIAMAEARQKRLSAFGFTARKGGSEADTSTKLKLASSLPQTLSQTPSQPSFTPPGTPPSQPSSIPPSQASLAPTATAVVSSQKIAGASGFKFAPDAPCFVPRTKALTPVETTNGASNTQKAAIPLSAPPKRKSKAPAKPSKKLPIGRKDAEFHDERRDWTDLYPDQIGTSTRKITFMHDFKMNDTHIDDIIAIGPKVTEKIWEFVFSSTDVSYEARSGMREVTSDALIRLAKACPNLKKLTLQHTGNLNEDCLIAFFGCLNITHIEILGNYFTGDAFDTLTENPDLAPKLKKLSVAGSEDSMSNRFMISVRALSGFRPKLVIDLVDRTEEKKWGDWELEETRTTFKNGRKKEWNPLKEPSRRETRAYDSRQWTVAPKWGGNTYNSGRGRWVTFASTNAYEAAMRRGYYRSTDLYRS